MYDIFVSFDYENDRKYKFMLEAWNANSMFHFTFQDFSSQEVNSNNVGRVKAALSQKIKQARYTLVIVGKYANYPHKDRLLIGYKNWINFEIAKSKEAGNKLIGIKLDRLYISPEELLNAKTSWAMSFTQPGILEALRKA